MEIVRYAWHIEILANFYGTPAYHFVSNGAVNVPYARENTEKSEKAAENLYAYVWADQPLCKCMQQRLATWSSYLPPPSSLPLLVVISTDKIHKTVNVPSSLPTCQLNLRKHQFFIHI